MTRLRQAQNVQPLHSDSIHLRIELATSKSAPWMRVKREERADAERYRLVSLLEQPLGWK
jgi:hypothetical protein